VRIGWSAGTPRRGEARVRRLAVARTLYVGIDLGKGFHQVAIVDERKVNRSGFSGDLVL